MVDGINVLLPACDVLFGLDAFGGVLDGWVVILSKMMEC